MEVLDGKPYQPIISKERARSRSTLCRVLACLHPNSHIRSYRIMNINEVNDAFVRGDLLNKLIFCIIGKSNSWSAF